MSDGSGEGKPGSFTPWAWMSRSGAHTRAGHVRVVDNGSRCGARTASISEA